MAFIVDRGVLEVELDTNPAKAALNQLQGAFNSFAQSATGSFNQLAQQMGGRFTAVLNNVNNHFQNFIQNGNHNFSRFVSGLEEKFDHLGLMFIKKFIQVVTTALVGLEHSLSKIQGFFAIMSVSSGPERAAEEYEFLRKTSDDLGVSLFALSENYGRLRASFPPTIQGMKDMQGVFLGVSEAARAIHANTLETQLIFLAVSQMGSKGIISMEELRRQFGERVPGGVRQTIIALRDQIQKETGKTYDSVEKLSGAFEKLVREGRVNSIPFIMQLGLTMHDFFGEASAKAAKSVDASIARVKNVWIDFTKAVLDSGGAQAISNALDVMKEKLSDPALLQTFANLVKTLADRFTEFISQIKSEDLRTGFNTVVEGFLKISSFAETAGTVLSTLVKHFEKLLILWGAMKGVGLASLFTRSPLGIVGGGVAGGITTKQLLELLKDESETTIELPGIGTGGPAGNLIDTYQKMIINKLSKAFGGNVEEKYPLGTPGSRSLSGLIGETVTDEAKKAAKGYDWDAMRKRTQEALKDLFLPKESKKGKGEADKLARLEESIQQTRVQEIKSRYADELRASEEGSQFMEKWLTLSHDRRLLTEDEYNEKLDWLTQHRINRQLELAKKEALALKEAQLMIQSPTARLQIEKDIANVERDVQQKTVAVEHSKTILEGRAQARVEAAARKTQEEQTKLMERLYPEIDRDRDFQRNYNLLQMMREMSKIKETQGEEATFSEDQYQRAVERLRKITYETHSAFEEMKDAILQFGKESAQAITDFLFSSEKNFAKFGDMVRRVMMDISNVLIYKNITEPMVRYITGSNESGGIWDSIVNFFTGRAVGGGVNKNYAYLVGERRPELFEGVSGRTQILGLKGPEVFTPSEPGYVHPSLDGLPKRASGGPVSSGPIPTVSVPVNVVLNSGSDLSGVSISRIGAKLQQEVESTVRKVLVTEMRSNGMLGAA